MRIIAGEFRSRRLSTPKDASTTRPMPDRVRESVFGLLRGNCEGAVVFDAFAGTGSVGLEAISRGASRCVFVERERRIADILRENVATLGVEDRCEVIEGDALGLAAMARCPDPVDLVFFDPPYALVSDPGGWRRVRDQFARFVARLSPEGFALIRTPWPFVHIDEAADVAAPRVKERRGKRRRTKVDLRSVEMIDGEAWEPWDGEAMDATLGEEPPARPSHHRVDLAIPGAKGPETHTYRTTAVHFYMRDFTRP